jgi:hypothetical protein
MTREEHMLMLTLYGRQVAKFNVLIEILKARGVLESDDLEAFRLAALEDNEKLVNLVQEAWKVYQSSAVNLGIDTGLQGGPFLPNMGKSEV